jgi:sugar/nucleoside kinase (ribokinase family)
MKITIVSNIAIDRITNNRGEIIDSLGGPPCYCGLTAKQFRSKVNLVTKFGNDISKEYLSFFKKHDLNLTEYNRSSKSLTTKFNIKIIENSREIYLTSESEPISINDIENIKTDCWLISPILNEISPKVLNFIISRDDNFIMVDPQGFTRAVRDDGRIVIKKELGFSLCDIDAIKLDPNELYCISGTNDFRDLQKWKSKNNINFLIFTENNIVHMLHKDKHYWLDINKIKTEDTTGAGDILSSAFTCSFIKENDFLWAFSFGVGASMAALKTKKNGIEKIPLYKYIEENASYNYNLLKYENL